MHKSVNSNGNRNYINNNHNHNTRGTLNRTIPEFSPLHLDLSPILIDPIISMLTYQHIFCTLLYDSINSILMALPRRVCLSLCVLVCVSVRVSLRLCVYVRLCLSSVSVCVCFLLLGLAGACPSAEHAGRRARPSFLRPRQHFLRVRPAAGRESASQVLKLCWAVVLCVPYVIARIVRIGRGRGRMLHIISSFTLRVWCMQAISCFLFTVLVLTTLFRYIYHSPGIIFSTL